MRWIIIFLLASFCPAVYSQTWIGTYNINPTCPTATCCCFTNQILVTRSPPNYLVFNANLAGYCFGLAYYYNNITDPNSYTVTTSISFITLTIQLSSDSNTITFSNSYSSSCNAEAIRQAAIVETNTVQAVIDESTTVQTTTVQAVIVETTTIPSTTSPSTTIPVYSQTWIGTYNINPTCPTTTCCCFTNQILFTRSPPNYLVFNANLAGYCFGLAYYYNNITDPNSYTITTSISFITLTIQLSSDSSTLTISNSYSSSCNAVAIRQAVIVQTTTVQAVIDETTTVPTTNVQAVIVETTTIPSTTSPSTTIPVYSQTWIGTYNINPTCPTTTCCCFTNQILFTRSPPNYLVFNANLAGYCFGLAYYYNNITDPNSYTITTSISFITLTIQLSSDSSTLTISNSYSSSCNAVAIRQAVIVQTTTVQAVIDEITTIPSTTIPSTTVPSTTIPSTTIPNNTVPSTTVLSTTVPSTTVPSITVPSTTVPSTIVPTTTIPTTTIPSTTVQSTTISNTSVPTTTIHSNSVRQYVNIIMFSSFLFFLL